jgi:hypothetical protein
VNGKVVAEGKVPISAPMAFTANDCPPWDTTEKGVYVDFPQATLRRCTSSDCLSTRRRESSPAAGDSRGTPSAAPASIALQ